MSDASEKSISFGFWSQLESILRPPLRSNNNATNSTNSSTTTTSTSVPFSDPDYVVVTGNMDASSIENSSITTSTTSNLSNMHMDQITNLSSSEEIFKRLNMLKSSESIQTRLKSFEDLIKLSELFNLNENMINFMLRSIRDLFKIEQTPLEYRKQAFEYLIQFFQKKSDKFETDIIKNHLLSFVVNNTSSTRCLFLNIINTIQFNLPNIQQNTTLITPTHSLSQSLTNIPQVKHGQAGDDLKYRFKLFNLITKNGTNCRHLDPELTSECLMYFLENNQFLIDKYEAMFDLFHKIIVQKYFQYLNDNLVLLLTRYILNFSFQMTNSFQNSQENPSTNTATYTISPNSVNTTSQKSLSLQHQLEIKSCVYLIEQLVDNLTIIQSINHVVLCLCELLDLTWQFQLNKTDNYKLNRIDSTLAETNEEIIKLIYQCMHKLFISSIGNCAIFTFFSEIFPIHKKHQTHRSHQINGALMHIKQIFEDFKISKLKNIYLIKELHLNCLIYLPNALKSCYTEIDHTQKNLMLEHILNLTMELVNLATQRELLMCLLTFNSRKFLIEISVQFANQSLDSNHLVESYANLLNLLDKKEVFAYKTSSSITTVSGSKDKENSLLSSSASSILLKNTNEDTAWIFNEFKETFYELIYKFPNSKYLKDSCINNCIEYYLQKKYLPCFGTQTSVKGIRVLLEKYYCIQSNSKHSIIVRKFLCDLLHKKLSYYFKTDQSAFAEEVIRHAVLPVYEASINDDLAFYNNHVESSYSNEYIELKYFLVLKLIDLTTSTRNEDTLLNIVNILNKIISIEEVYSIDLLPNNAQTSTTNTNSILSPSSTSILTGSNTTSTSSNLFYLSKIISGLITIFENNFTKVQNNNCSTKCCKVIFNILVNYLDQFYTKNNIQYQTKYLNYYGSIRKEIFEFLLRLRSDKHNKLILLNQTNRRAFKESHYLLLTLDETKINLNNIENDEIDYIEANIISKSVSSSGSLAECQIDIGRILKIIELCLDKESDWNVLMRVLSDLPYFLQYEMSLVKQSTFINKLIRLFYKKDLNAFRNKPENISKLDYMNKYYPLLASLILFHPVLERNSQESILQTFALGINPTRNRYCLEILTIAIIEMHEFNSMLCGDILLKLSQFSPNQNMAMPVLELLSTMSEYKRIVDFIFGRKELYISVLVIAIKYTNPIKFDSFIVQLAHYVLCIWFLKSKQEIRKSCASFICKGLHKEVIHEIELLNSNSKSLVSNGIKNTNDLIENNSTISANSGLSSQGTDQNKDEFKLKKDLSENLKIFFKDLVEITIDFMSNNMFFDTSSMTTQFNANHNRGEFFVDIYSNLTYASTGLSYLRSNSLINHEGNSIGNSLGISGNSAGGGLLKNKGQSRQWLVGNKIIQIKTGLFSNICLEDAVVPRSKQAKDSEQSSSTTVTTLEGVTPGTTPASVTLLTNKTTNITTSAAIDIPSSIKLPNNNLSLSTAIANNDSIASSNNSSTATSISNNNSFSSVSLNSNFQQSSASNALNTATNELNSDDNLRQDIFDVAIDSTIETVTTELTEPRIGLSNESQRRTNELNSEVETSSLISSINNNEINRNSNNVTSRNPKFRSSNGKRRYNSGLATTDRNENDVNDDFILSRYNELEKKSLDDSDSITSTNSYSTFNQSEFQCQDVECSSNKYYSSHHHNHHRNQGHLNNSSNHHHHHHRCQYCCSRYSHKKDKHSSKVSQNDGTNSNNICQLNCWCNNLVEITCRYPTKVTSFVTLIETNNCSSHLINMSIFENIIKSNKLIKIDAVDLIDDKEILLPPATPMQQQLTSLVRNKQQTLANMSLAKIAEKAIDMRKNTLTRISESSSTQETAQSSINNSPIIGNIIEEPILKKTASITRASSTDEDPIINNKTNATTTNTASPKNTNSFLNSNKLGSSQSLSSATISTSNNGIPTQIDPSQVFLHLFQSQHFFNEEKDQPILIPDTEAVNRSMNILDYLPCFLIHKIGIVYVGKNQVNDEKLILSNTNGSVRYRNFLRGLGNLIYLKDMDTNRFYPGGLDTDGSAGDFTLLWYDGITQVLFHAATMMLNKDENCNLKKRHIGNDSTIIVYNESGEEYQFSAIKGEVNSVCIEIIPLKSNTNIVKVKTTNELQHQSSQQQQQQINQQNQQQQSQQINSSFNQPAQSSSSVYIVHTDPKFVSDQNLSIIVRKMALHADIASKVYSSHKQGNGMNFYGGKWYERLRQINRIKKFSKEYYAKQQLKMPSTSIYPSNIETASINKASMTNPSSSSPSNMPIIGQNLHNQSDFTNYI